MTLATTPPALDHGLSADDLAILRTTLAPYRDRLTRLALEDSLLPVTVDVTLYRTIIGTGLQDHIDTAARELVL